MSTRQDQALGRSRGGLTTKLHLRVEGGGRPLVVLATAGQRQEAPLLRALLNAGVVKGLGPDGRPGRVGRGSVLSGWWPTRAPAT